MIDTTVSHANPTDAAAPRKRGGGPKTPEGRERSRRNSLRHGLCSNEVLPYDLGEAVARRTEELTAEFQPRSPYAALQVGQMALAAAKLDRCAAMTIADVRRVVQRAGLIWDHDRRMAVEGLGAKLAKDPAGVVAALRGCKQGAIWLGERWELLGLIAANNGDWTEEQRRLALDLLGVPAALREGSQMLPAPGDAEGMAELVAFQLDILRQDREAILDQLDAAERAMAMGGMLMEEDATTARLRKYEASCRRAFNAAKAELLRLREAEEGAEASQEAPPPSHKAPLSEAAIDNLVKRARIAHAIRAEAPPPEPAPAPAAERPAVAEAPKAAATVAPVPTRSSMVPAAARNRRERRAQAKRDRQAARRAASGR
jgi:hypothetical protein